MSRGRSKGPGASGSKGAARPEDVLAWAHDDRRPDPGVEDDQGHDDEPAHQESRRRRSRADEDDWDDDSELTDEEIARLEASFFDHGDGDARADDDDDGDDGDWDDDAWTADRRAAVEGDDDDDPETAYAGARVMDLSRDSGDQDLPVEVIEVADEPAAPLIAIVGRPNVGKSRLFNRMTRTRFAIVEDMPGVTRDRQYGEGTWDGRAFQVVDTGGFEPDSTDELLTQMREQARIALEEADIILFVLDSQSGLMQADRDIAALLRRSRKPIHVVANKVDGESQIAETAEFWELGIGDVYPVSAEHGLGFADLMDEVAEHLPRATHQGRDEDMIRVAVVGRPNAGKSTLINRLLGQDRLLTSNVPGTTRDAINTRLTVGGQRYLFIDTAGIRKKKKIFETVEKYSVVQAFKAMDRADVAVLVLDATEPVSTQDQRICGLAHDKGCGLIIVLNKWDLVEKDHKTADAYVRMLRDEFKFAAYAPVVTISAMTGQRVHRLLPLINDVAEQRGRRVSTASVNQFLEATVRRRSPPQKGGRGGFGPSLAVWRATSAISAVREARGCDCHEAQAPSLDCSEREAK